MLRQTMFLPFAVTLLLQHLCFLGFAVTSKLLHRHVAALPFQSPLNFKPQLAMKKKGIGQCCLHGLFCSDNVDHSSSKKLASKVFGPYSRKQTKDSAVMHSLSAATQKMVQRPRRTTACAMMAEPVPSSPSIPSAVLAFTPTQEGSTPRRAARRSLIAAL